MCHSDFSNNLSKHKTTQHILREDGLSWFYPSEKITFNLIKIYKGFHNSCGNKVRNQRRNPKAKALNKLGKQGKYLYNPGGILLDSVKALLVHQTGLRSTLSQVITSLQTLWTKYSVCRLEVLSSNRQYLLLCNFQEHQFRGLIISSAYHQVW